MAGAFWAVNAAMAANPIVLVVAALAALAAGLVVAYRESETFRAIVDAAFKGVTAAFGQDTTICRFGWVRTFQMPGSRPSRRAAPSNS